MTNGDFASPGQTENQKGLSFVTTINSLISTPGEILLEEFLQPLGISDIVHGRRAISVEMAWLLSRALGTTPEFWLNLETTYQIKSFDEGKLPAVEALIE